MMNSKVHPWDVPVVSALDEIEELPGFEPDHVQWDDFRFYGTGARGPMNMVSIYAYPSTGGGSGFVRFGVSDDRFTVTDPAHRHLTPSDVARTLSLPADSAEKAGAALAVALPAAINAFNAAHGQHAADGQRAGRQAITTDLASQPISPRAVTDRSTATEERQTLREIPEAPLKVETPEAAARRRLGQREDRPPAGGTQQPRPISP